MSDILITDELIEAVDIVRGSSEPFAVGRLPTKDHLNAAVAAFRDAFNVIEGSAQMLEQAIGMAGKQTEPTLEHMGQCAVCYEDMMGTIRAIKDAGLFGEHNTLGKRDA